MAAATTTVSIVPCAYCIPLATPSSKAVPIAVAASALAGVCYHEQRGQNTVSGGEAVVVAECPNR